MIDLSKIKTYPIRHRKNKFFLKDMLPLDGDILLDNPDMEEIAGLIVRARELDAPVILMLGGAVVKTGCSAIIIDLIRRGFLQHVALNGGASIHDFELALIGETSEDVANGLEDGTFGMAEETLAHMNRALNEGAQKNWGYGYSIAKKVEELKLPYRDSNILYSAVQAGIPGTVHIAIGGDIIHQHPSADGAALGRTSFTDFHILTDTISRLKNGVLLNVGSAVNLPEVFLKCLTMCRNLGYDASNFTTVNFDFMNMYRPRTRIVEWPKVLGCRGFDIRGNHAETMPTLYRHILHLTES